jgi:hypothetical protein
MPSQERQVPDEEETEGQTTPTKGPSDPGGAPEGVPSEEDAEQTLPGVPDEAADRD